MTVKDMPIRIDTKKIARFCHERGIRKMSIFGSVIHGDFDPGRSDVDVLVELSPDAHPGLAYFGYGDDLSKLIGHKVDMCSRLNRHIESKVIDEAVTIYEQS